jgi:hypothetical protein
MLPAITFVVALAGAFVAGIILGRHFRPANPLVTIAVFFGSLGIAALPMWFGDGPVLNVVTACIATVGILFALESRPPRRRWSRRSL